MRTFNRFIAVFAFYAEIDYVKWFGVNPIWGTRGFLSNCF